ncbi:MAG: NAD-dependent epimerase [Bacteroidota bacterium]
MNALSNKKILVTGAAGFIGYHLCKVLLETGCNVIGLDNISGYYDISLKLDRLRKLGINKHAISEGHLIRSSNYTSFGFIKANLQDKKTVRGLFLSQSFDSVVNLAAQAGVRYSVENPNVYIDSNIVGFINLLEVAREFQPEHVVFASSSSVYGANTKMPFSVADNVDHPLSIYAATKKSNELMAHAYSHLFAIPMTGLRFFTVYGPWGRPDMALFLFADAIVNEKPIKVFNNGDMARDFTYIGDVVSALTRVIQFPPIGNDSWNGIKPDPGSSKAPYRIYNIGRNKPVQLMSFIKALEHEFGKKAVKEFLPLQPGDVPVTYSDVSVLKSSFNFVPQTSVEEGIKIFAKWYREYYKVGNRATKH